MPARRGRGRGRGDQRIDAALDHFVAMGYASRDVRRVVADLLKLYGGPSPDVWRLLEEGSYQVVQDKLFEKEEEEKQKQQEEEKQKQEEDQALGSQHVEEEEPPQHQEPAVDAAENEVPAETESADDEVEDPMFTEPSALEAIVPLPAAVGIGYKREPCYGWLTESDDEE